MTREEWHKSIDFLKVRRFHNRSFDVGQLIGELYEELQIMNAEYGPLASDKLSLYERQLNVLRLEADRLRSYGTDAARLFEMVAKRNFGFTEES